MLKRLLAILVIAAAAAACNSSASPAPSLSLEAPSSTVPPVESPAPVESTLASP